MVEHSFACLENAGAHEKTVSASAIPVCNLSCRRSWHYYYYEDIEPVLGKHILGHLPN